MQQARDYLIEQYLDYRNNYLTIALWPEHNGLAFKDGLSFLAVAKIVFESNHPEA